jgi:putative glutamine amidotransferase
MINSSSYKSNYRNRTIVSGNSIFLNPRQEESISPYKKNIAKIVNRNRKKPLILVTGPNKGGLMAWLFTAAQVYLAGGIPKRARPKDLGKIDNFDALILGGGTDLHPTNYTEQRVENIRLKKQTSKIDRLIEALKYPLEFLNLIFKKKNYDPARDKMEIDYLKKALKKKIPILGICRGHQLVHAYFGGSLVTDTKQIYGSSPRVRSLFARKEIFLTEESSILKGIFDKDRAKVNALHDQAVFTPALGFRIVAQEYPELIQATEADFGSQKILSVQWHPEYLIGKKQQRRIFRWLVKEANSKRKKSNEKNN